MATIMTHFWYMNFRTHWPDYQVMPPDPSKWMRLWKLRSWIFTRPAGGYHVEFLSFGTLGVGRAWMKEFFFVWLKKAHLNTLQVADFQWFPGEDQFFFVWVYGWWRRARLREQSYGWMLRASLFVVNQLGDTTRWIETETTGWFDGILVSTD